MRYALILLLALAGSVRGDDGCDDCVDACAPEAADVCTECIGYSSADECYDVCVAQHGQKEVDEYVAAGCPDDSYSYSYSHSYGPPPECMLDCLDGNGSWDCDLFDTCLGDCEFPLGEDLPDEQAAYDYLYTEFWCAAAEMVPAWCPDPSTFEGDAPFNPDDEESSSCSQTFAYVMNDWGVTPDGCSTEAGDDQQSETWLAGWAGSNCCGGEGTRDACGGLLDMSLWCADTNAYDPDAVFGDEGSYSYTSCQGVLGAFSMYGASPRRCSDDPVNDMFEDTSDQDLARMAELYCCGDDPETDVCDEDYMATLCAEDEYVSSNSCETCAPATTRYAGDDPSGDNTECAATLCAVDEYVASHVCTACSSGTTNEAGDDASGADTVCALSVETEVAFNGLACADYTPVLQALFGASMAEALDLEEGQVEFSMCSSVRERRRLNGADATAVIPMTVVLELATDAVNDPAAQAAVLADLQTDLVEAVSVPVGDGASSPFLTELVAKTAAYVQTESDNGNDASELTAAVDAVGVDEDLTTAAIAEGIAEAVEDVTPATTFAPSSAPTITEDAAGKVGPAAIIVGAVMLLLVA